MADHAQANEAALLTQAQRGRILKPAILGSTMKRTSRAPSKLSESLHQKLNSYALAAGAAGVSALALAQPAEAKIVYTPAHVNIGVRQPPFPLDLNHDGFTDFYLLHVYSHFRDKHEFSACQVISSNTAGPFCRGIDGTNQIRATAMGGQFEAALRYGTKIQRDDRFDFAAPLGGVRGFSHSKSSSTYWFGPWINGGNGVKNRYLGLKFKIKGKFHFGWARLTITTTKNNFTATLTGYAYETIPGKAIIAGQTKEKDETQGPSLGALAAGANALPTWK